MLLLKIIYVLANSKNPIRNVHFIWNYIAMTNVSFENIHVLCFQAMYVPYGPGAIVASMCVLVCLLHVLSFQAMYVPYGPGAIVASMCVMVCLLHVLSFQAMYVPYGPGAIVASMCVLVCLLHVLCFQAMYVPYGPGAIVASMCVMVCLLSLYLPETKGHELPKTIDELKQWYKDNSGAKGWKPFSNNRK